MVRRDISMADYLVDLCLKYFFRAVIAGLVMGLFIELLMKVDALRQGNDLQDHVWGLALEVMSGDGEASALKNFAGEVAGAAVESLKLWLLAAFLVMGFGIPFGLVSGRLVFAARGWSSGGRGMGRVLLFPCFLLNWLPAFVLASCLVFYLVDFQAFPVFDLIKNGARGFGDHDSWMAEWWRLLLPAGVVAVSGIAWLAREVAYIIRSVCDAGYVGAAEERGLSGEYLYFSYVVKNSLRIIGSAILRSLPYLLSSLILVEWVFRFPGLGLMTRTAVVNDDFVRLLAVGGMLTLMVILGGFLLEVFFGFIDKKTREEGGLSVMSMQKLEWGVAADVRGEIRGKQEMQWRRMKQAGLVIFLLGGVLWGIYLFAEFRWGLVAQGELGEDDGRALIQSGAWRVLAAANGTLVMSLVVSILTVLFSFCVAGMLGWLGGWRAYCLLAKVHAAAFTVPVMFWLLAGLTVSGSGFWSMVCLMVGIGGSLGVGVLSRWFLDIEFQGWVEAARAAGLSRRRIFLRHFVPALWLRMFSRVLLLLPPVLLYVVAMDFSHVLEGGAGTKRWGGLMQQGVGQMWEDPRLLFFSVVAVWGSAVFFALIASWTKSEGGDRLGPDIY